LQEFILIELVKTFLNYVVGPPFVGHGSRLKRECQIGNSCNAFKLASDEMLFCAYAVLWIWYRHLY
jgi:hypothetical protein